MAAAKLSDEAFSAILEAHPGLRERFASIATAVANSGENLKEADAIEERIVEEMRLLGRGPPAPARAKPDYTGLVFALSFRRRRPSARTSIARWIACGRPLFGLRQQG